MLQLSEERSLSSPLSIILNRQALVKDSRAERTPGKNKMMEEVTGRAKESEAAGFYWLITPKFAITAVDS